jgi:putative transposase
MKSEIKNKIPAVLRKQAKNLARYELFVLGKNAVFSLFQMLFLVIQAGMENTSLEIKSNTPGSPSADDILYHLKYKLTIEKIEEMQKHFVKRTVKLVKRMFGGRKFAIAIDFTDEMYYGDKNNKAVVGTKPKAGASYAYKYLTVNIVVKGARIFLFSYPVFKGINKLWIMNRALCFLEECRVDIYLLLLDREFYTTDMIAMLGEKYRYLIPAKQDSRFKAYIQRCEKFPAIVKGWRMKNREDEEVETNLIILEEIKDGEKHIHGYITNMQESFFKEDAYVLSELYSKRWGIETGHRVEDRFRIKTTCKNGVVRYLFFAIGILLYNLWVFLNLFLCQDVRNFRIRVKVDELKEIAKEVFDEFWELLLSPARWFHFALWGAMGRGVFLAFLG